MESAIADARYAALDADRAALETLSAKVYFRDRKERRHE